MTKKSSYQTYEYSSATSKNAFKINLFSGSGILSNSYEFEYDDKKSPFTSTGIPMIFSDPPSENNVTKIVYRSSMGTIEETRTYLYEYNNLGYPVKFTGTSVSAGSAGNYQPISYVYDCK